MWTVQLSEVGFHVLRGDSWGELTVQLCVIAVNGFPVLITGLQKDEENKITITQFQ